MDVMGYIEEAADAVASAIKQVEEAAVANDDAVLLEDFPRAVQLDRYSCGAQCVYMVLQYFGRGRAFKRLKRRLGTTQTCGTQEDAMLGVLRSEGLRARWRQRMRLDDVREAIDAGRPVIAVVDDETHWLVVYGYDEGGIYVADPSPGHAGVRETAREFARRRDRQGILVGE